MAAGKITKTAALREEADEPELRSKPRVVFAYDRGHAGRLNELILEINRLGRQGARPGASDRDGMPRSPERQAHQRP